MSLVNWNDAYLIGEPMIDADHKRLFELINEFHFSFTQNGNRDEIRRLLNELIRYAEAHFQREEALMQSVGFPGLNQHQQIHFELITAIFGLHGECESASTQSAAHTVKFLRYWLTEHILDQDKQFAAFLAQRPPHAADAAHAQG